jgi:hypothetical protein
VEGKKIRNSKIRLKASILGVQTTFHQSHDIRHYAAFHCLFGLFKEAFRRPEGPYRSATIHAMGPLAAGGRACNLVEKKV